MTTTVTKTIKSAAGDYSSLSGWESGQQANITAGGNDTIQVAQCFNFALTDDVGIAGWTTDATHYLSITVDATAALSGGKSRDVTGTGFQITSGSGGSLGIIRSAHDVHVTGINIKATGTGNALLSFSASQTSIVDSCVMQSALTGTGYNITSTTSGVTLTLSNNVVYGGSGRLIDARGATSVAAYFNTVGGSGDFGWVGDSNTVYKNNFTFGFGTACFFNNSSTGSNNASSDTSVSTASIGSVVSLTVANELTNVSAGSEDFSLKAGNHLADAGTAAGSIFVDIMGTVRPQNGSYDIGAFETVAAGGSVFTPYYYLQYVARAA